MSMSLQFRIILFEIQFKNYFPFSSFDLFDFRYSLEISWRKWKLCRRRRIFHFISFWFYIDKIFDRQKGVDKKGSTKKYRQRIQLLGLHKIDLDEKAKQIAGFQTLTKIWSKKNIKMLITYQFDFQMSSEVSVP